MTLNKITVNSLWVQIWSKGIMTLPKGSDLPPKETHQLSCLMIVLIRMVHNGMTPLMKDMSCYSSFYDALLSG